MMDNAVFQHLKNFLKVETGIQPASPYTVARGGILDK